MEDEYNRVLEDIKGSELLTAYEKEQKMEQAKEYFQMLERQLREKNTLIGFIKKNVLFALFFFKPHRKRILLKSLLLGIITMSVIFK